jgi:hypothetical protein
MVWFRVKEHPGQFQAGAVLECSCCRTVMTTGNFMDRAHLRTPIIVSPR